MIKFKFSWISSQMDPKIACYFQNIYIYNRPRNQKLQSLIEKSQPNGSQLSKNLNPTQTKHPIRFVKGGVARIHCKRLTESYSVLGLQPYKENECYSHKTTPAYNTQQKYHKLKYITLRV